MAPDAHPHSAQAVSCHDRTSAATWAILFSSHPGSIAAYRLQVWGKGPRTREPWMHRETEPPPANARPVRAEPACEVPQEAARKCLVVGRDDAGRSQAKRSGSPDFGSGVFLRTRRRPAVMRHHKDGQRRFSDWGRRGSSLGVGGGYENGQKGSVKMRFSRKRSGKPRLSNRQGEKAPKKTGKKLKSAPERHRAAKWPTPNSSERVGQAILVSGPGLESPSSSSSGSVTESHSRDRGGRASG